MLCSQIQGSLPAMQPSSKATPLQNGSFRTLEDGRDQELNRMEAMPESNTRTITVVASIITKSMVPDS